MRVLTSLLILLVLHAPARAEEPTPPSNISWGLTAAMSAVAVNLRNGDLYAGGQALAVGPCFDVTYRPWETGGSACANYQRLPENPNAYSLALFGHWHQLALGVGFVKAAGEPIVPLALLSARAEVWMSGK